MSSLLASIQVTLRKIAMSQTKLLKSESIKLPKPALKPGRSLARALRRTIREIGDKKLSLQTFSDLLWAANVHLFAASVGLAAWFHNCYKSGLSAKLRLRKDQHVLFGQTVGYQSRWPQSSFE